MRFKGLDLNLLLAFEVLLAERSVTKAAHRLSLTQPAMSSVLGRLRAYFGDDILTTHNKRMYPTPFAENLRPAIQDLLATAENIITKSTPFNPETSERSFTIGVSDYLMNSQMFNWLNTVNKTCTNMVFNFITNDQLTSSKFEAGEIDIIILPQEFTSELHPADILFEEDHVVLGWSENPLFDRDIDESTLFCCPHVTARIGASRRPPFADRHLDHLQKARKIAVTVGSFTLVPQALVGNPYLAIVQRRLAVRMAEIYPVRFQPLPFPFPVMREMLQFHQSRATDEGVQWLRDSLRQFFASRN